jgi:glycosyltransferase involved in cell wall biosynthesis
MTQRPLSCFIIAKNEADRIAATIRSVIDLVDEVVVVDSGSTDGTQALAESLGARVIFHAWPGFGQQKRFAEDQCRNDWLLNLDADEVVPEALKQEIAALFAGGGPSLAAYGVDDLVVYPGHKTPRPFARDHFFYRLYDRRRVRFANSTLFDNVDVKTEAVGRLAHPLHHFSVRSLDDLIAKCDERASYNADNARRKSRVGLAFRIVTEFPMQFLKYYLVRTHITGGLMGFQYAMILAFYRFIRIVRMYAGAGTKSVGLPVDLNVKRPNL